MSQPAFVGTIVGVMIFAGSLGGVVNYLLTRKNDPDGSTLPKSITLGIGASLLVPLFLNMISSNLLELVRGSSGTPDLSKALVFLGFCLVAAISSTAFIRTLSDRVLQEAREAKKVAHQADKKASEAQSVIQPILEKETEGEDLPGNTSTALLASVPVADENERKLLTELANGRWVLRTRTGLAKETGIPKPAVDQMMDDLKKRDLVDYKWIAGKPGEKKKRWYITNKGRTAIPSN